MDCVSAVTPVFTFSEYRMPLEVAHIRQAFQENSFGVSAEKFRNTNSFSRVITQRSSPMRWSGETEEPCNVKLPSGYESFLSEESRARCALESATVSCVK